MDVASQVNRVGDASSDEVSVALSRLSCGERSAVLRHRERLSLEMGCEVTLEYAFSDWNKHCSLIWRSKCQAHMLALQRQEILRHKWIESEKAHRDLGSEAVLDWIRNYAAMWREWYEGQWELGAFDICW